MQGYFLDYEPYTVITREGEASMDLYFLQTGKLLICTISGTQVKAIARINAGEFIGELSFFDGKPRSSHIVTLEKSKLIQIPKQEITPLLPKWYMQVGRSITKKIRLLDQVIHSTNQIRKGTTEEQKPLTIDEQRILYNLITQQNT